MKGLTVGEVAKISYVSIKTLRYYDSIGLLIPSQRDDSRYRRYSREDLVRLQSILFYKELDFTLVAIKELLDSDELEIIPRLKKQRELLLQKREKLASLLKTMDKTIDHMETHKPLTDEELYEGFSTEEIALIKQEVNEQFDEILVAQSNERIKGMNTSQWESIKSHADDINLRLVALMHKPVSSNEIQTLIADHYKWVSNFYECTKEVYIGLAHLYVDDARFNANYEKVHPDLANFLSKAMLHFAETQL